MATVAPGRPRSAVVDTPAGLMLSIPTARNPFLLVFLPAWLVGWGLGWRAAFSQLSSTVAAGRPDPFLLAWLAAWSAGGGFAIWALLWSLVGREVVLLRPGEIVIARKLFGLGRTRRYDVASVSSLRVAPESYGPYAFRSGMRFWGMGGGPIAFDYGASTIRFGASVEEAEASMLVRRLLERQPSLGKAPAA